LNIIFKNKKKSMTGKSTFRILSQRAGGGARSGIKDFKEWFQEMLGEM
jgi:hypothetical protein